jgi:hypothetical protein
MCAFPSDPTAAYRVAYGVCAVMTPELLYVVSKVPSNGSTVGELFTKLGEADRLLDGITKTPFDPPVPDEAAT